MITVGSKWTIVRDDMPLVPQTVTVTSVTTAGQTVYVRYDMDQQSVTGTYSGLVSGWHASFRPTEAA